MGTVSISPTASIKTNHSEKSVHWSPILVRTERIDENFWSNEVSEYAVEADSEKSSEPEEHSFHGPPLSSMRDELLSEPRFTRESYLTSKITPDSYDSRKMQEIAPYWVTVFGFSREDASEVLKLFARHGAIVAHQFPKEGNWMYLRYASPIHARQSLFRNGQIMKGGLRLGVIPVEEHELARLENEVHMNSSRRGTDGNNKQSTKYSPSFVSENSMSCGIMPLASINSATQHPMDTHFRSSSIASPVRRGIRSLRASYNAADNYYRVYEEPQPEKSYGLLERLWNLLW